MIALHEEACQRGENTFHAPYRLIGDLAGVSSPMTVMRRLGAISAMGYLSLVEAGVPGTGPTGKANTWSWHDPPCPGGTAWCSGGRVQEPHDRDDEESAESTRESNLEADKGLPDVLGMDRDFAGLAPEAVDAKTIDSTPETLHESRRDEEDGDGLLQPGRFAEWIRAFIGRANNDFVARCHAQGVERFDDVLVVGCFPLVTRPSLGRSLAKRAESQGRGRWKVRGMSDREVESLMSRLFDDDPGWVNEQARELVTLASERLFMALKKAS